LTDFKTSSYHLVSGGFLVWAIDHTVEHMTVANRPGAKGEAVATTALHVYRQRAAEVATFRGSCERP
jgi:hypothetical protein